MVEKGSNMSDDVYAPRVVHEYAARVLESVGQAPLIERVGTSRWRLTVANDRVCGTLDFKLSSGGRCVWAASALVVDGKRQEQPAEDLDHFGRIFRDPSNELDRRERAPAPMGEPISVRPVEEAPSAVREIYAALVNRLGDKATVQVGADAHFWTLQVEAGVAVLRLNYRLDPDDGSCGNGTPIQLVIDGQDRSDEVGDGIERALAMMLRPEVAPTNAPPPVNAIAGPARSNSVEVRRATVIRN
jgi:hypothetical protein